jgi:drug/metabolite transporter (DMT)-like permease
MGIVAAIVSMVFAGISAYLYKRCSPLLGPTNTTFFYYLSGFVIASIVWFAVRERTPIARGDLIWPFFTALSLFVSIWTFNYSLQVTNVSVAAPIRGMSFVITALLAVWFSSERLFMKDYIAMTLAIAAVAVFALGQAPAERETKQKNSERSLVDTQL